MWDKKDNIEKGYDFHDFFKNEIYKERIFEHALNHPMVILACQEWRSRTNLARYTLENCADYLRGIAATESINIIPGWTWGKKILSLCCHLHRKYLWFHFTGNISIPVIQWIFDQKSLEQLCKFIYHKNYSFKIKFKEYIFEDCIFTASTQAWVEFKSKVEKARNQIFIIKQSPAALVKVIAQKRFLSCVQSQHRSIDKLIDAQINQINQAVDKGSLEMLRDYDLFTRDWIVNDEEEFNKNIKDCVSDIDIKKVQRSKACRNITKKDIEAFYDLYYFRFWKDTYIKQKVMNEMGITESVYIALYNAVKSRMNECLEKAGYIFN
jgi:hypothetical protein